jgi:polar amino acid transport system substrate-binding protein
VTSNDAYSLYTAFTETALQLQAFDISLYEFFWSSMITRVNLSVRTLSVGIAAMALLAGCSANSATEATPDAAVTAPKGLVESGALTYGVAATFPPFEYLDGTENTGFDIEMGAAIAKNLGLKPKALDIDFDGLIPALQGNRVDIINSAMYINDERSKQVDFVPYMEVGEALLVPTGNEENISEIPEDLSGLTIAVTRGAIGETYMTEYNTELEAAGLKPMTILALPTNQDALLAVQSGRAAGFDTSTPGAAYTLTEQKGVFEVAATFKVGTEIGIAVPKDSAELKAAITKSLQVFVDSGDYATLMEKYNLPADSSPFK